MQRANKTLFQIGDYGAASTTHLEDWAWFNAIHLAIILIACHIKTSSGTGMIL